MSQQRYVLDFLKESILVFFFFISLKEFGMLGCKPIDTPIEPNHKLSKASDDT